MSQRSSSPHSDPSGPFVDLGLWQAHIGLASGRDGITGIYPRTLMKDTATDDKLVSEFYRIVAQRGPKARMNRDELEHPFQPGEKLRYRRSLCDVKRKGVISACSDTDVKRFGFC